MVGRELLSGALVDQALIHEPIDGAASLVVFEAIWADEEPWDYPLEQMAQSYVFSYANKTEEH